MAMLTLAGLSSDGVAQTSATASGTLHALAGGQPPQNYSGPFPFGGTTVSSGVQTVMGTAMSTTAWLYPDSVSTASGYGTNGQLTRGGKFQLSARLYGSSTLPYATNATATVTLHAPVGAGVRLRVLGTQTPFRGSSSITVLGVTYTDPNIVLDTVMPAGGLTFSMQTDALASDPFIGVAGGLSVWWSYPGVIPAGDPTPGCLGDAIAWTRGTPEVGNATFGITGSNAHPGLGGVVVIGFGGLTTPFVYDFVDVWVDPFQPHATLFHVSNPSGDLFHPLPIPNSPSFRYLGLFAQWLLLEPAGCTPLGLSGSNAIAIRVQ